MHYLHYDVFTNRPFEGNQLAVFPEPGDIGVEAMLAITREMNYSETVFVLPAGDAANTCRLRIFTPGGELPFAGHPTVGTAIVLAVVAVVAAVAAALGLWLAGPPPELPHPLPGGA